MKVVLTIDTDDEAWAKPDRSLPVPATAAPPKIASIRPCATFVAHLYAVATRQPQMREKGRAPPDHASELYRSGAEKCPTAHFSRRV